MPNSQGQQYAHFYFTIIYSITVQLIFRVFRTLPLPLPIFVTVFLVPIDKDMPF